ncbi:hypothetical protein BD769DRAFT_1386148 [Suillus cothurnatus]|nr:hypothetical protein BD769DRAFT_1386148 [Suillus cothurnatus]
MRHPRIDRPKGDRQKYHRWKFISWYLKKDVTANIFDKQNVVLLDRSTPAWLTQLQQASPPTPDFLVQEMHFDIFLHNVYGNWEEHIHPSGVMYYYNATLKTYTGFNNVDGNIYMYYLVAPEAHIIGWVEPLDSTHLFCKCNSAQEWNHKRLKLDAQFWKHVEFFPSDLKLDHFLVRKLWTELDWFHAGSNGENHHQTGESRADDLVGSDGTLLELSIAFFV